MAEISVDLTKLDPDPLNMYVKTVTRRVLEYAQHSHIFIFYNKSHIPLRDNFLFYIFTFLQQEHYFQFYNKGRENTR